MSRLKLNVILLLDEESRKQIKIDITELAINGVHIIYDLSEITKEMLDETKKVILLEKFPSVDSALTNMKLYKEVFKLKYYYIGIDKAYLNFMELIATCYKMDISFLDYEKLYAIMMNDLAILDKHLIAGNNLTDSLKLKAESIVANNVINDDLRQMAKGYLELYDANLFANELIAFMKSEMEDSKRKLNSEIDTSNKLISEYSKVVKEVSEESKHLKQYEMILTKDVYTKMVTSEYQKPPFIVYLKEYDELIHFNRFLWTLSNSIYFQLKKSVKVLKLFDSSASKRILKTPKYYKVIGNEFKSSDVLANDYLCKSGDHTVVLDMLLTNTINLDVLIIVDCKDHDDIVVLGSDITFNLCRNISNLPVYNLSSMNTIVNNARDYELSWDSYKQYPNLRTNEDKLLFLSAKPVIKGILESIEIGMGGV